MNYRQIALEALLAFFQKGKFLEESFKSYPKEAKANELAMGTLRHSIGLGDIFPNAKLKTACLLLLKMALYEYFFMSSFQMHATVNETVELAKRYSPVQAKFLNAILRTIDKAPDLKSLKKETSRYSLPQFVYERLKKSLPREKYKEILEALLERPKYMIRSKLPLNLPLVALDVYLLEPGSFEKYLAVSGAYIQNITPVTLMHSLYEPGFRPLSILDMCAAPGGKLLLAHEFYPKAKLYANDSSLERLKTLKANLERLNIEVGVTHLDGKALSGTYDLIILDAPCSNTGVMHKKIEAKYRLCQEELDRMVSLSKELLMHAKKLLKQEGQIWFMTCSILREENEDVSAFAVENGLKVIGTGLTIYPNKEGYDGGFAQKFQICQ